MADSLALERYDMSGRREALMLCVKERHIGASGNLQIMEKFFTDYGFRSEFVIDESAQEMRRKLRAFRDRINQSEEDISCVLVVTSSHGNRGVICDAQGGELRVEDIIQCFDDQKCPRLKGKPKVFMLSACRGGLEDPGVSADAKVDQKLKARLDTQKQTKDHSAYINSLKPPCIHDMLVLYATRPDFAAYMSSEGSDMFVKMAEVLKSADTEKEHIRDVFVKVNEKVVDETSKVKVSEGVTEDRKAVLTIESTLTKGVYLGRRRRPTPARSQQEPIARRLRRLTWPCCLYL
ncbi:caspase-14-like [Genypterus blacodes]|uniref:caspase-14-like n=1 Tax=Genypterus blacodes TaxID=154954 RepID=UPI003F76BDBA